MRPLNKQDKEWIQQLVEWCGNNGVNNYNEFMEYIKDNPVINGVDVNELFHNDYNFNYEFNKQITKHEILTNRVLDSKGQQFKVVKDSLGRKWDADNWIERAVRFQMAESLREYDNELMDELGFELVEISAISNPSPLCAERQGRVYARGDKTVKGYKPLEPELWSNGGGLFHPNCRHHQYPFDPETDTKPTPPRYTKKAQQEYKERQEYMRLTNQRYRLNKEMRYLKKIGGNTEKVNKLKQKIDRLDTKIAGLNFDYDI